MGKKIFRASRIYRMGPPKLVFITQARHRHKIGKAAFIRSLCKIARAQGIYSAGPGCQKKGGQVCTAAFVRVGAALFVTQDAVLFCGKIVQSQKTQRAVR